MGASRYTPYRPRLSAYANSSLAWRTIDRLTKKIRPIGLIYIAHSSREQKLRQHMVKFFGFFDLRFVRRVFETINL